MRAPWRLLPRVLLTLAMGAAGTAVFQALSLPLPWMLGSMTGAMAPALGGLPVAMSNRLRSLMVAVLGLMLGSTFTPDLLGRLPLWTSSLSALLLYVAVSMVVCQTYYRRLGGYDPTTAYFTAAPGGLSAMVLVGAAMGGDERAISLGHAARVVLIVLVLPFGFQLFGGYEPAARPPVGDIASAIPPGDLVILFLCGVIGFIAAQRARLPAADFVGPLALSAAVHLAGLTESRPPTELVDAAQLVVGTSIGARFAGIRIAEVLRAMMLAIGGTALLLLVTAAFATGLHSLTGLRESALLLAFSPGGVAEMSLVALALGIDAAYVATHHVVRIIIIAVTAPIFFRLMQWRQDRGKRESG